MNTKELFDLIEARNRMCDSMEGCSICPLLGAPCDFASCRDIDDLDRIIRTVKEWDAAHPVLEEVGKGIYYDPKNRIVPDEITRVYTIEVTYVIKDGHVHDEEITKQWRKAIAPDLIDRFPEADDVKCVKVQQLITKCHEEEV